MTNNIDLTIPYPVELNFILCHKPCPDYFQDYSNRLFISDNGTPGTITFPTKYDSRIYGELGAWQYIATQIRDCDRASLNHFRRKLPLSMSNVVVAAPIRLNCSLLEQTAFYHSIKIVDAIKKALPPKELEILNENLIYPYTIAKMPRPMIWDFVNFIEPRMLEIMRLIGCPTNYNDLLKWVENDETFCKPVEGKDTRPVYQARLGGFIVERLSTLFWRIFGQKNPFEVREVKLLEPNQSI